MAKGKKRDKNAHFRGIFPSFSQKSDGSGSLTFFCAQRAISIYGNADQSHRSKAHLQRQVWVALNFLKVFKYFNWQICSTVFVLLASFTHHVYHFCTARLWLFSCLMSQLPYFSLKCFTMFTLSNTFEDGSILCNCGNWRLKERSNLEHLSLPQKALKSFLWSDYIAVILDVVLSNPGLIAALRSAGYDKKRPENSLISLAL